MTATALTEPSQARVYKPHERASKPGPHRVTPDIVLLALIGVGNLSAESAREYADDLAEVMNDERINCLGDMAIFLALALANTRGFTEPSENFHGRTAQQLQMLWPSVFPTHGIAKKLLKHPIEVANKVYANQYGNRSESSGDGYLYRGRGICRIRGRTAYRAYQTLTHLPLENIPEHVAAWPVSIRIGARAFTSQMAVRRDGGDYHAQESTVFPAEYREALSDSSTDWSLFDPLAIAWLIDTCLDG